MPESSDGNSSADAGTSPAAALILDAIGVGVLQCDLDGRCRFGNVAAGKLAGVAADRLTGDGWLVPLHPEDSDRVRAAWQSYVEGSLGENPFAVEYRYLHADAHFVPVSARASQVSGADGTVVAIAVTLVDTADRLRVSTTRAETGVANDFTAGTGIDGELRSSRQFLESIAENIPNMVFLKEADELRFSWLNRAGEELLGYSRAELIGKNDFDFFPHDEAEFFVAKDREVLARGETLDIPTEPIQTRLHGERLLHTKKVPIFDDAGLPAALLGISEDITEQTFMQAELRERQETLNSVFEASPDAIVILSPELTIDDISTAIERLLAIHKDERKGTHKLDGVHPDDRAAVEATLRRLMAGDTDTANVSYRVRHADGQWVPVEARARVRNGADGRTAGVVLVERDVSEAVAIREALQVAKAEAERANQAKSQFLSRMSHELRTPLNSVLGFAQILQLNLGNSQEQENVRHIYTAALHLLGLINEVLDVSRIEAGVMSLSVEPVALGVLLRECVELVAPQAQARAIELLTRDGTDRYVRADRSRLKQVVLNLLSNAIKFNRDGGSVVIDTKAHDAWLRIGVTDTGPGLSPELAARLFTPFDRLGADVHGIEGTGLGLALSKGLVEAMGGILGVETTPGKGSTFWFELPIGSANAPADEPTLPPANTQQAPVAQRTVLYIEDNAANVRLIEQLLLHRPAVCLLTAVDGASGLESAVQHTPDLILLDVHLPDMSGSVVLQRLRADPRTLAIPVVILSADATEAQIARLSAEGANYYLTKPLDVHRLLEVLDQLFDPAAEESPGEAG